MQTKTYKYVVNIICTIMLLFTFTGSLWALDDDNPFFAGSTGLPNVMFIFDNSDSMQDLPYLRKDGSPLRPSGWKWRTGVYVDPDGTISEDVNGNIRYDHSAYTSTDVEVGVPSRTPPPIPGIGALTSVMTKYNGTSYLNYIICDENINWADPLMTNSANFNAAYRYYKVMIEDGAGNKQYRTITGRKYNAQANKNYWQFYRPNGAADNLDLSGPEPYTYTILTDVPGTVTREYLATGDNLGRYVFDANVDWSVVYPNRGSYYGYKLEVIQGTNAGESRRISWISSSGYWQLESGFPENCDYSTRYRIVGSPDDDRKASGGNHPASKLYQAKKALKAFLESDADSV